MEALLLESEPLPGIVELTLNRPARRNALDAALLDALRTALTRHMARAATRVLIIGASGSAFCAGADLDAMLATGRGPLADNVADAERLAHVLLMLRQSPKPVIGRIQGPAFGGGVGIAAACDVALAAEHAVFRLPEVQLGLVPAVISPYVLEAIGPRAARRYVLSGELLSARTACALGLVHEVVAGAELEARCVALAAEIARGGPLALAAAKRLIAEFAYAGADAERALRSARILAEVRAGTEAQEGISAALEQRSAGWRE